MKASQRAHIPSVLHLKRHPERGSYDRDVIHSIVDEAWVCHVAWVSDGVPWVIPTAHWRVGDWLVLHGSSKSRMVQVARAEGACTLSVSIALVDGLVLARSAFNHSMNYRSVIVHGSAYAVEDPDELDEAARAFVDKMERGRSALVRAPDAKEWRATGFVKMDLRSASAKVRSGPPKDQERDLEICVSTGVVPFVQQRLPLEGPVC